jgi:hypothetical protein
LRAYWNTRSTAWSSDEDTFRPRRSRSAAFDAFITTDKNLRHQQNLPVGKLAILVLPTTSWPVISRHQDAVATAVNDLRPGELRELSFGPMA